MVTLTRHGDGGGGGDNLGSHRSRDPSLRPELTDDPWPEMLFVVKLLLS